MNCPDCGKTMTYLDTEADPRIKKPVEIYRYSACAWNYHYIDGVCTDNGTYFPDPADDNRPVIDADREDDEILLAALKEADLDFDDNSIQPTPPAKVEVK